MMKLFGKGQKAQDHELVENDDSLLADGSDVGVDLEANAAAQKKQKMALIAAVSLMALGGMYYVLQPSGEDQTKMEALDSSRQTTIATDDIVNRNLGEKEWMALSQSQMDSQQHTLQALQNEPARIDELQKKLDALQSENSGLKSDGTQVLGAYQKENDDLKAQIEALRTEQARVASAGPNSMYGPGGPAAYQRAGSAAAPAQAGPAVAPAPPVRNNEIRMISFGGDGSGGTGTKVAKGSTVFTDSENYLPPNSIAPATVVVGVDATTTVKSQGDPLPVVLRITGPARSVYSEGKLLRTNLTGCMVNGSAMGDLSSEKVYVKLAKMTCPQPNGRVAVSEVKGFISFGGKTGVRGHVVSRAGNLVGQAFIAGVFGGIGKGAATNSNSFLSGSSVNVNGTRQTLSPTEIATGGLGNGVAESANMVSKYLIERAEQYQPVVEMPTGIKVEVVFLDGTFIRN